MERPCQVPGYDTSETTLEAVPSRSCRLQLSKKFADVSERNLLWLLKPGWKATGNLAAWKAKSHLCLQPFYEKTEQTEMKASRVYQHPFLQHLTGALIISADIFGDRESLCALAMQDALALR